MDNKTEEKVTYSRKNRREITKLNEMFDSLVGKYRHQKALNGDSPTLGLYLCTLDNQWRKLAGNHNRAKKSTIKADLEAFMKHIEELDKMDAVLAEEKRRAEEQAKYDRWVAKCTLKYPNLMRRWNLMGKIRKDYVKKKYEELEGKSPR